MDLFADLKRIVEQHLQALGVQFPASADLERLILLALNHELKTISRRTRKVHFSKEFITKKSCLDATEQGAADAIFVKFEKGQDISGHLCKSSAKPAETDKLLADWKIHHLHISNHKDKPTDTHHARTGPVMFAHVGDDAVYFIDVYPHGNGFPETWTRQELLKIIDENWPHILDPYRAKGITGLPFKPTDMQLRDVRGANMQCIIQVGSSFITPLGGGLATDGTPSANVFRMNRTFHLVKKIEQWVKENSSRMKAEIASKSGFDESELDFELVRVDPEGLGVVEKKTRTLVGRTG